MRSSGWMVLGLVVGLVGCRQTQYESCVEIAEISCECGEDPYEDWGSAELEEEHACDGVDNLESRCSLASDEEVVERDWACVMRKFRKTCDYDGAIEACGYEE